MDGPRGATSEGGFTLLEVLVVVALAAVLVSILTLGIRRAAESFSLRQAGSMAVVEARNAQAGAMSNGVDYVVEFDTSAAGGPPGRILVFRPGVPATGAINVISSGGADTRSVTVVGIDNGTLRSDTFFLDGTTAKTFSTSRATVTYQWILEVETATPNSCCTISVRQGSTVLATVAPSQPAATGIPWTQLRAIASPEWPAQVRMDAGGTTLPLCSSYGAPWTSSANHCLRYGPLGHPDQGGRVLLLCNRAGSPLRIAVAAGTGRVGMERAGTCP
jgi:prepilin-type N-terminal cleavage/methylation domain-containing protein